MALTPAERQKQYRERHRDKVLAYKKDNYEKRKEELREKARLRMREWRAKNPGKSAAYCRNWYKNNKGAARKHRLKKDYDLTPEQVEQMITEQGNKCALCEKPFELRPVIDHNHRTGKVRGIICCPCNRTLLRGRDNIEYLQKAIDYLRRYDTMQAQTNDIEVGTEITDDPSSGVSYELKLELINSRLSPAQRAALHKLMVQQARQLRMALMFALPDQKVAKASLMRKSSWKGNRPVPFFEE